MKGQLFGLLLFLVCLTLVWCDAKKDESRKDENGKATPQSAKRPMRYLIRPKGGQRQSSVPTGKRKLRPVGNMGGNKGGGMRGGLRRGHVTFGDPHMNSDFIYLEYENPYMYSGFDIPFEDPYMYVEDPHMYVEDPYMYKEDPYMYKEDPYMYTAYEEPYYGPSEECICEPHYEQSISSAMKEIGETMMVLAYAIGPARDEIKMSLEPVFSVHSYDDLVNRLDDMGGMDVKSIFPYETDYSIIGETLREIFDATEFWSILDNTESFLLSYPFQEFAGRLLTYDDHEPVLEFLIRNIKETKVHDEAMNSFARIHWIKQWMKNLGKTSWVEKMIHGAGKVFGKQECFEHILDMLCKGGNEMNYHCGTLSNPVMSSICTCVEEKDASVEELKLIQAMFGQQVKVLNSIHDEGDIDRALGIGACVAKDPNVGISLMDGMVALIKESKAVQVISSCLQTANCAYKDNSMDYMFCLKNQCGKQ